MVRIKRYIEIGSDGQSTGRVLYFVEGELPPATSNALWQMDPAFKIEDDMTHDPEMLKHYGKALIEGFVVVSR